MRACRTIELGPGRDATIYEARVCDIRRLIALLPDDLASVDLLMLAKSRLPDLIDLLSQCLSLPRNETVDDLAVSECEMIVSVWWEMNKDFFLHALAVIGYDLTGAKESQISIDPV